MKCGVVTFPGSNCNHDMIYALSKILNQKVMKRIIPDMITAVRQDDAYIKQLDKPIDPIPLPVNVNSKGRKQLPSITTTF